MIDPNISVIGAISALLLPWLVGTAWTFWLLRPSGRWNAFVLVGQGYLLGILLLGLFMRGWDAIGLTFSYWPMASVFALLGLAALPAIRLQTMPVRRTAPNGSLPAWAYAVIGVLLVLIAMRYFTIVQEVLLRPLFPWDAWMNWAPKALVWFHYSEMVPFVPQQEWLAAAAEAHSHLEGARNAWKYPVTVPLVQLWGMLGAGTSDHTLPYMAWVMVALAMGSALYGHLRLAGVGALAATVAAYALLNMPFVNVHSALAGYADIWVAAAFGGATFALYEWSQSRHTAYAALALLLALLGVQLKIPGLIMGGFILAAMALAMLQSRPNLLLLMLGTGIALLLYIFLVGIDVKLPGLGRLSLSHERFLIPYVGNFEFSYHNVWGDFYRVLLTQLNWNLLWPASLIAVLAAALAARPRWESFLAPDVVVLLETLAFLLFVYLFTPRYEFAQDNTQINRAVLYAVPVVIFLASRLFCGVPTPKLGSKASLIQGSGT